MKIAGLAESGAVPPGPKRRLGPEFSSAFRDV
jgi:hypothetical protein